MNWYIAKLVFRIVCGDGQHTPQFDEQLWLVEANNYAEALDKAKQHGRKEENSLPAFNGGTVDWRFVAVEELYQIPVLTDGISLYSKTDEAPDVNNYLRFLNYKADKVEEHATLM